jgi:hypothetical protein
MSSTPLNKRKKRPSRTVKEENSEPVQRRTRSSGMVAPESENFIPSVSPAASAAAKTAPERRLDKSTVNHIGS